jgi:hypothetical protein
MTKAQEIEALKGFAASLPQNTYIAEWLAYIIPSVERDIISDIIPDDGTSIKVMVEQMMESMRVKMQKEMDDHDRWMAKRDREVAQRDRFAEQAIHALRSALRSVENL